MTLLSWIYMSVVWTVILAVTGYCFYRIFTKGNNGSGR